MYISPKASRIRQREAQRARDNRAEIVKARSLGQVTRRDLIRWGIFTAGGTLVCKNRLSLQTPVPVTRSPRGSEVDAVWGGGYGGEPNARRLSYHTDFTADPTDPQFKNPITNRGPMEGRPPGEIFAHQRWEEFFPKEGYVLTLGQIGANECFYPGVFPYLNPNSSWTYATGHCDYNTPSGTMPPPLIKGRYGVPII